MDKRLGRKGADGAVEVWPSQYPHGGDFNKQASPAPTTLALGDGYFVVLPIGVAGIPDALRDELLATVQQPIRSGKSKNVEDEG